jgi:protein arginine N-methyltransferase 1
MATSYSLGEHARMIGDRVRMDAYAEALRRIVKPGSTVLDIGTGTGVCALLACRFGARRVYAVEPDQTIEVARATALANACADRIIFLQDLSTRLVLPERVDVIVSDLRGALPLFEDHLSVLADARRRHLAAGGTLIPQRDHLDAAVVEAPEFYRQHMAPWEENGLGLNLEPVKRFLSNTWGKARLKSQHQLTEPQRWAELDYATREHPDVSGTISWVVVRSGQGHGFICWFDTTLAPGAGFSNAPAEAEVIYGQTFFPWPSPVPLTRGDAVSIDLRAHLVGGEYVWSWVTRITGPGGEVTADFKQSTFLAMPLAPAQLRRCAAGFLPVPGDDVPVDRFILGQLTGQLTLGEITDRLVAEFPDRFPAWNVALTRVGEIAARYGR